MRPSAKPSPFSGGMREAAIAFDRAIKEDPTFFDAYYLYGRVSFESGDLEKAAKTF